MGEWPVPYSIVTSRCPPSFTDFGTPVSRISEVVCQPQSMYGWVALVLKYGFVNNGISACASVQLWGAYHNKITGESSSNTGDDQKGSKNHAFRGYPTRVCGFSIMLAGLLVWRRRSYTEDIKTSQVWVTYQMCWWWGQSGALGAAGRVLIRSRLALEGLGPQSLNGPGSRPETQTATARESRLR
jgi:hypothetical protein